MMNTIRRFIALIFLATGAGTPGWSGGEETAWLIDHEEARDAAQVANRPVFILFTGSDWCVWCERTENEIPSTPQFTDYARENLILLKIDFPKSIKLPEDRIRKNRKLQKQYGITGYPTVVITDSDGAVLGRLSYENGGPEHFLGALSKIIE